MVDHFFRDIEGQFDDDIASVYQEAVRCASQEGAKFVEIGVGKGKSTAFMLVEIMNSGKKIDLYVVDKDIDSVFRTNMENNKVINKVNIIAESPVEAANRFADNSLDFVFLYTSHVYTDVRATIAAWLPKVKSSGFIGGHFIERLPVRSAVQELIPWCNVKTTGTAWSARKERVLGKWLQRPAVENDSFLLYIPYVVNTDLLHDAVKSLLPVDFPLVVIDGSDQGLPDLPWLQHVGIYRTQPRLLFTQTQNIAQKLCFDGGYRWLCFMHADASCTDNRVVRDFMTWVTSTAAADKDRRVGVYFTIYDVLCAFNAEALKDIGVWDETFPWYWSDIDYYYRLKLRGWQAIEWPDKARIKHVGSGTRKSDNDIRLRAESEWNWCRMHFRRKWGGPAWGNPFRHSGEYAIPYNTPE